MMSRGVPILHVCEVLLNMERTGHIRRLKYGSQEIEAQSAHINELTMKAVEKKQEEEKAKQQK